MTIINSGIGKIRIPDYQENRWDIPCNENWKLLASAANNLHSSLGWLSGLAATDNGSNVLGIAAGILLAENALVAINATTKTIPLDEQHFVYSDSSGTITNSLTLPLTEITVLYFVKNNAGTLEICDVRKKGFYTLPTPDATNEGNCLKINSNGVWAIAKSYGKQQFFNGKLDHWQRGTSFTTLALGADGTSTQNIGTTKTFSRQAFSVGSEINGCKYFCRTAVTSVANSSNYCNLRISIEDLTKFSGNGRENIYLSFYAKADSAKYIALEAQQNFGNSGSSSVNGISSQKILISSSWQRYFVKFVLPSISGKTIGTGNGYSRLDLFFWFDAGSSLDSRTSTLGQQSGTFDIADIQVISGEETFNCSQYSFEDSFTMAKRYYEIIYAMHDSSAINNTIRHTPKAINPYTITWALNWGNGVASWQSVNHDAIFLASMPTAGFGTSQITIEANY